MSSQYSYFHSISRILKSKTLKKEAAVELLSVSNLKDLFIIMKRDGFIDDENTTAEGAERQIKKKAIEKIRKLNELTLTDRISSVITGLYYYDLNLPYLEYIVSSVTNKRGIRKSEIDIEDLDLINAAETGPKNLEELSSILKETEYGKALKFAMSFGLKNPGEINTVLEFYPVYKISELVDSMKGDWKSSASSIICAKRDFYAINSNLKLKGVNLPRINCKVSDDIMRDVQSSEITQLPDILRRTSYSKDLDLSSGYSALNSFYRLSKKIGRKNAKIAFLGMPFSPTVVLAICEMIKLDVEDLISITSTIAMGRKGDSIKEELSLELI